MIARLETRAAKNNDYWKRVSGSVEKESSVLENRLLDSAILKTETGY